PYYDAVHAQTVAYVEGLIDAYLDTIVDESWDPPVTLGVRLVSVLDDDLQHVGQAGYVRGFLLPARSAPPRTTPAPDRLGPPGGSAPPRPRPRRPRRVAGAQRRGHRPLTAVGDRLQQHLGT